MDDAVTKPKESLLTQMRKSRGLSLAQLAKEVGTDQSSLSRVERGLQIPNREVARNLYRFYDGSVTLGHCYDPEFAARCA